jgi:hypothetical protein
MGLGLCALVYSCASGTSDVADSSSSAGRSSSGGRSSTGGRSGAGGQGALAGSSGEDGSGGEQSEPNYGRFGEPEHVFTLPGGQTIYYPDLVGSFPEVDFETLDRLYIPAGEYRTIMLGSLPERSPERPLVITNQGGQVKVGGQAANYVMSMSGGGNWILTGRYDPVSQTGDAGFRGHVEGGYAHSQDTYGIVIDDAFSKEGLSGLAIGGKASDFELDCFEVRRVEFAGIIAKTDGDGSALMRNVKVHDLYVHDTGSEGIYFGSTQAQPQHAFENLKIYDNRFLRTGTEALQIGQQGHGLDVHHNVLGPAAIRWRSAFQKYQDGNVQYGQRYGSGSFHHNIVIGTGDLFVEFFPTLVDGDPRQASDKVSFTNNYFSDSSLGGVYTHAIDTGVTIEFSKNVFRGFRFNYDSVYPDTKAPVQVFGVGSNSPNPHLFLDNQFEADFPFLLYSFPSVTAENNEQVEVPPVRFRKFMGPEIEQDVRRLEWWTSAATLSPDGRAVTYPKGAFVMHQGVLYRALKENAGLPPDEAPDVWEPLPDPADDVRLAEDSPQRGLGVRWPPATN